jgi:hypothetical protein
MKRDRYLYGRKATSICGGAPFEFASRSFDTATEAEDYMRRYACNRIDSRMNT